MDAGENMFDSGDPPDEAHRDGAREAQGPRYAYFIEDWVPIALIKIIYCPGVILLKDYARCYWYPVPRASEVIVGLVGGKHGEGVLLHWTQDPDTARRRGWRAGPSRREGVVNKHQYIGLVLHYIGLRGVQHWQDGNT